jgi:single-strand DNA-binding protein
MPEAEETALSVNAVRLVGRMSGPAEAQTLPSGDELVKFRVIVQRPPGRPAQRQSVDALDCVVWTKRAARTVGRWKGGDVVEVEGSLRRRFFGTAAGAKVSRCEVEVTAARLIRRTDE